MTRNIWHRVVAGLFDKKSSKVREQVRRRRLGLEWLEERLAPAIDTWTGASGAGTKWSDAANWSRGGIQQIPQTGDELVFAETAPLGNARKTNNDLVGLAVNKITISGTGYTLGGLGSALGNMVTLNAGGGGFTVAAGVGAENLALDLQLGASPKSLTSFSFTINAGDNLNVTGRLSGATTSTLLKVGTGTMTLNADDSTANGGLNGAISIQVGIVNITNAKALGTVLGGTTVLTGAQLQITGGGALGGGFTVAGETLDLNGQGSDAKGALHNMTGNNTWSGNVILDSDAYIGANINTSLAISGTISDNTPRNLDKVEQGTVIFSHVGGNTYRGLTTIQTGILSIQDPLSLGAAGSPQSGTVVNYKPTASQLGTLQLNFASLNPTGDPNGILTDPTKPFDATTNPYIGFQVFDEQLTLNGTGFNGLGALYNLNGNNQWNGPVILGSVVANSTLNTQINIAVAAPTATSHTDLTISGVISDPNRTPALAKTLGGRLILNNANTYRGSTEIVNGIVQVGDSHALGTTSAVGVTVDTGAALEMAVDAGLDGTALKTHNRNLGFDSVTANGPGQELVIVVPPPPVTTPPTPPTTDTFTLTFKGQTTGPIQFVSATSNLAADIEAALNALSSVIAIGGVTVTQTGNVYRVQYNDQAMASASQLPLITYAITHSPSTTPSVNTITVNPIYSLNVSKTLNLNGTGVGLGGALRSVSGINTYSGPIALGRVSITDGIGVDPDTRAGHPTADANYFTRDYSLTVSGVIGDGTITPPLQEPTLAKFGTGQLILQTANTYLGQTDIQQGWITIQNSKALGRPTSGVGDTVQPAVFVRDGAALHLKALTPGANINLDKNVVLAGIGLANNPYAAINKEGALLNLAGANVVSGNVMLASNVGIGVQNLNDGTASGGATVDPNAPPSQLTITGAISRYQPPPINLGSGSSGGQAPDSNIIDTGSTSGTISISFDALAVPDDLRVYYGPRGTPGSTLLYDTGFVSGVNNISVNYPGISPSTSTQIEIVVNEVGGNSGTAWSYTATITPTGLAGQAGLTKYGTNRLILEGPGTYTGAVNVKEGTASVRNDTALGQQTSGTGSGTESFTTTGTTVQTGATLELGDNIPTNYGGVQAGVQVNNENLTLQTAGQQIGISGTAGLFTLTFRGATTNSSTAPDPKLLPPLNINSPTLAADIQAALNALSSIGGIGGSVTVTKTGSVYQVVFGGTLAGTVPLLTAAKVDFADSVHQINDAEITIIGTTTSTTGPLSTEYDDKLSKDILWGGNVTLASNTVIDVAPQSRLTLSGQVNDLGSGASLTKRDEGELVLSGPNTYRGTTFVNGGILTAANSQALGAGGNIQTVQDLTLTGSYQFNLTINGQTTGVLDTANPTLANDIAAALDALPTVSGGGGSVAVVFRTDLGNVFEVTFTGGSLLGNSQQTLGVNILTTATTPAATRNPNAGSTAKVTVVAGGSGGTIVANGSTLPDGTTTDGQLQIRGNLTIAGESLALTGNGSGNAPTSIPVRWFGVGPAPINNAQTAGNQASTGRVTGLAVDPTDPKVMYLSSAGGGAWKTIDGGKTWTQLFDSISATQTVTVTGTSGTFTLSFTNNAGTTSTTGPLAFDATPEQVAAALNALPSIGGGSAVPPGSVTVTQSGNVYTITFSGGNLASSTINTPLTATGTGGTTALAGALRNPPNHHNATNGTGFALWTGAIAIAPSDPHVIYLGTGETDNSGDSYYGTGVYKSTDSGRSWTLLTDSTNNGGTGGGNTGVNPLYGLGVSKLVVDPQDPNTVYVATSDETQNAPANSPRSVVGVYRYSGVSKSTAPANTWVNLTAGVSASRSSLKGQQSAIPMTAGPQDDFRMQFPQRFATWSDISVVGVGNSTVLYAALGTAGGDTSNAVFRTADPSDDIPIWYVGAVGAAQNEIQTLVIKSGSGAGGSFQLSFKGQTTNVIGPVSLTDGSLAAQIQSALESLSTIGFGNITVAASGTATLNEADFTITFVGNLANSPQPAIGIAGVNPAPDLSLTVTESQAGGGADNESNAEFPSGSFSSPFIPRNGNIKFTTVSSRAGGAVFLTDVTIYAAITVPSDPFHYPGSYDTLLEIQKSTDGGQTWKATAAPPAYMGVVSQGNNQGEYDSTILAVSATQVYAAGVTDATTGTQNYVVVSTDGGKTWTDVSVDAKGNGPHSDAHAMAYDGKGNLILGNDGGVWSLNTGSNIWTDINGNLAITTLNGISQNPFDTHTILAASQDNGTELTNGSQAWGHVDDGDGGIVHFDPNNPLVAYHVLNGFLEKSIDGGKTWLSGNDYSVSNGLYFPFVVDPISSRVVVGGPRLQESLDAGTVWDASTPATWNTNLGNNIQTAFFPPYGEFFGNFNIVALATYQGDYAADSGSKDVVNNLDTGFKVITDLGAQTYDPNTIYVSDGFHIAVTKDHGASWQDRTPTKTNRPRISDIEVDPSNRDIAFFTVTDSSGSGRGRVFRTEDAGQTWTNISGTLPDVPVYKMAIDPRSGTLYVGTENGVWALPQGAPANGQPSVTGTFTWQHFGAGMPSVAVTDLDLNLSTNTLTAATYGRSAFQAYLGEVENNSGALRVLSGSSEWNGPVYLTGPTTINIDGTRGLLNGSGFARLDITGVISDLVPGANNTLTVGGSVNSQGIQDALGDLVLSGTNTYGGWTHVVSGNLIVNNPSALGAFNNTGSTIAAQQGTTVESGSSLELETDLLGENVQISGAGSLPGLNGHDTGSLRSINSTTGNVFTFTGNLTLASNSTIGVDSGSQLTITGRVLDVAHTPPFNLTKELTGTLILSGVNSYTGNTTVNQGILGVASSTALGAGATATVLDGAQMQIQGTGLQIAQNLVLSGTGISAIGNGVLLNTGGNNKVMGNVTLTDLPNFAPDTAPVGTVVIGTDPNTTLTIGGVIDDGSAGSPALPATGLSKVGQGRLVLQGADTYTGSTYVHQGTLEIQNSNALGQRGNTSAGLGAVQQIVLIKSPLGTTGSNLIDVGLADSSVPATSQSFAYGASSAVVTTKINALLASAGYTAAQARVASVTKTTVPTVKEAVSDSYSTADATSRAIVYTITFTGTVNPVLVAFPDATTTGITASASTVADAGIGTLVSSGAQLALNATSASGPISTPSFTQIALNGTGSVSTIALNNLAGNNTIGGEVDLQTDSTVTAALNTTLAFTGVGTGTTNVGVLSKSGAGTLEIDTPFSNNVNLLAGILSGVGSVKTITGSSTGTTPPPAFIAPGDNLAAKIGTLTVGTAGAAGKSGTGNVTLTPNDQFFVDLGNASSAQNVGNDPTSMTPGDPTATPPVLPVPNPFSVNGANDLLFVNGRVNLNGASLNGLLIGSNNKIGDTFEIIETDYGNSAKPAHPNDVITGHFAGITVSPAPGATSATQATISGATFRVDYYTDHVTLTQLTNSTSTTVTSPTSGTSVYGQAVTFSANVTYTGTTTPTGSVAFFANGVKIGDGTPTSGTITNGTGPWTYTTTPFQLAANSTPYSITATYTSTNSLPSSTSPAFQQTVNQDPTATDLVVSQPNGQSAGQAVTLTATVKSTSPGSGTPTAPGYVNFFDSVDGGPATQIGGNFTLNSSGVATFTTTSLPIGSHKIHAVYSGDSNYITSTSPDQSATVLKAQPTKTTVISSKEPSTVGQSVTFTATVTNAGNGTTAPTGVVTFSVDGGTPVNGTQVTGTQPPGQSQWTFTTSSLSQTAAGSPHTITATYSGDNNDYLGSSGSVNQDVNAVGTVATTTSNITSSAPSGATTGQQVTFSVTVKSGTTNVTAGSVTFVDTSTSTPTTLGTATYDSVTGTYHVTASFAAPGSHSIVANYSGTTGTNGYAASSSAPYTQVVVQGGTVATTTSNITSSAPSGATTGQQVTFSVTVKSGTTNVTAGSVTFVDTSTNTTLGTATYDSVTGTYHVTASFAAPGSHSIVANYSGTTGTNGYAASSSAPYTQVVKGGTATTIAASPTTATVNQVVTLTGHVSTSVPGSLSGSVTIYRNGAAIGTAAVNASTGNWSFATSFPTGGTYSMTAAYNGDPNFAASAMSAAVAITVTSTKFRG